MNRRDLLKMISAATGTALVGGGALLAGCARAVLEPEDYDFDNAEVALLDEVAEIILPRTDTPGAKDARVGQFMTVMVNDCYTPEEQTIFHRGLLEINAASQRDYDQDFIQLSVEQRRELVEALDREARQHNLNRDKPHYFTLIKQLTLLGFFTSEIGAKQALRYIAIPGYYNGCIPYEEGDRGWATK